MTTDVFARTRRLVLPIALISMLTCLAWGMIEATGKPSKGVSYPNFSKTKGLRLNGDAARAGKVLRLTEADNDQLGSAFTKKALVKSSKSFKAQFRFNLHDGTLQPGDGMVFVLQGGGAGKLGNGGGGIGYSGIGHSVAVEFDTFLNPEAEDPSSDYVGLLSKGNTGKHLATATPDAGVYGGKRSAWVEYSAKREKLKVFFSDKSKKPKKPLLSKKIDIKNVTDDKSLRAGFTASTGGSFQASDILSFKLK